MCRRVVPIFVIAYLFAALLPFFAAPDMPQGAILICTPEGARIIDPATGEEKRIAHQGHQCCCLVSAGQDNALAISGIPLAGAAYKKIKAVLLKSEIFQNGFTGLISYPRAPPGYFI